MIQNSCRHQAIQLAEARLEHRDPGTRQAVDWEGWVGVENSGFWKVVEGKLYLL